MAHHAPWFVTGTDTEIGKTWASLALLRACKQRGRQVVGMKPVASGCAWAHGYWRNEDALLLQAESSLHFDYEWINPYAFEPPISPHFAALKQDVEISLNVLIDAYQHLQQQVEQVIIEGAGGWRVPLSEQHSWRDFAIACQADVVLVVGLRLGCINHALLSAESIQRDGLNLIGWIANPIDPNFAHQDSISTLQRMLPAPLLGCLPYQPILNIQTLADALHLPN